MDEPEDDTHDALAKEFLEYFKANERFFQRKSVPKRRKVRKHLANIMRLAKQRRAEIVNEHREKYEIRREAINKAKRQNNE
jgi:hypothetical protein